MYFYNYIEVKRHLTKINKQTGALKTSWFMTCTVDTLMTLLTDINK